MGLYVIVFGGFGTRRCGAGENQKKLITNLLKDYISHGYN